MPIFFFFLNRQKMLQNSLRFAQFNRSSCFAHLQISQKKKKKVTTFADFL